MTRLEQLLGELPRATDASQIAPLAEEVLNLLRRDDNPMLWANMNGAVASSQVAIARGRYTPDLFKKVMSAYTAALSVYTPEETPALWGQTQRNIGATHLGAVQSGIGDARQHVEAAIAAYTRAIEIPHDKDHSEIWFNAQFELANAHAMAAGWRGQSAFVESARAYRAALSVASRDASPEMWAMLNLRLASSLSESGAAEYVDDAIQAAEHALEVIHRETQLREWAELQLLVGGLYRMRKSGDRGENLERATSALEHALSVMTEESDRQGWYRAHYHRGPAYLFLRRGDRKEHLRRSLESLGIAISATPRERAPDPWASLTVCLGQALLESHEIDAAIAAFEDALMVLPPDPRSLSWKLANRYLGEAYVERSSGNADDNIELAIERLTTVQHSMPVPDDTRGWTAAYAKLGEAYARRARGECAQNRDKAIECFEAALTVPPSEWDEMSLWVSVQARLVLLYLDEKGDTIGEGRRACAQNDASPEPPSHVVNASDPFDLAGQARAQAASLRTDAKLDRDPGWHVPWMLNEEASLMRHHFGQFLRSGDVAARDPEQRSALERQRWRMLRLILEHVGEKNAAAERTRTLFREIEQGKQTFVLFLRGFAYRAHHYAAGTVVHGGGAQLGEKIEKKRLVEKLAPLPLVWISNPVDSGPMDVVEAGMDAHALGFRIEMGDSWERDVETLIGTATFIVFHNPVMTPGLVREIALVERLGRLDDAFFYQAKDGQRKLDDDAFAQMRANAKPRALEPGVLPAVTCRWIEGQRRETLETEVRAVSRWVSRLTAQRNNVSRDLELDAYFYLVANVVLLEEMDRLPTVLQRLSDVFRCIDEKELKETGLLAEACSKLSLQRLSAKHRVDHNHAS